MKCVAYLRKSTQDKQANSLATQRREIEIYAKKNEIEIIAWFEESISGTIKARPIFAQAIKLAKKNKCAIIAKSLSRIGRNASQVLQVIDDVELVISDMGQNIDANLLGMMAIVNQMEVKAISTRTKQALAYLKAQGAVLGNPRWNESIDKARQAKTSKANAYALSMEHIVMNDHSTRRMASILNDLGLKTRAGKDWTQNSIFNLRKRINLLHRLQRQGCQ